LELGQVMAFTTEQAMLLVEDNDHSVEEESPPQQFTTDQVLAMADDAPSPESDDGFFTKSYRSFVSGLNSAEAMAARVPALAYSAAAAPQNIVARVTGWNVGTQAPAWLLDNPITKHFEDGAKAYDYVGTKYAGKTLTSLLGEKDWDGAADLIVQSAIQSAPTTLAMIGANIAGVSVPAVAAAGGALQGAQTYKEARDKNLGELEAVTASVLNGSAEAVLERASFGLMGWAEGIFKDFGKRTGMAVIKNGLKAGFGSVFGEGGTESITQMTQDLTNKVYGVEDIPWNQFIPRAIQAGAIGAVSGAAMTLPVSAYKGLRSADPAQVDDARSQKIVADMDAYVAQKQAPVPSAPEDSTGVRISQTPGADTIINNTPVLVPGRIAINTSSVENPIAPASVSPEVPFSLKPDVAALQEGRKVEAVQEEAPPAAEIIDGPQMEELTRNTISEFRMGEEDAKGLDMENLIVEGKPRKEIYDRAKYLRDRDMVQYEAKQREAADALEKIGRFYLDPKSGITEETKAIPKQFLRGKYLEKGGARSSTFDEVAERIKNDPQINQGRLDPESSTSDVIKFLSEFSEGKKPRINEYLPDAKRQVVEEMQGEMFTRVQPGIKAEIRKNTGQVRPSETPTITERQALAGSLLAQARAASMAEKSTKTELRKIKSTILDVISNLPVAERGRFGPMLVSAENARDVSKATVRVYNHLNETIRRAMAKEISTIANRAINSDAIDVQYRERIKGVIDGIQFKSKRADTLESLNKTQQFIDKEKAAGRNPVLPQRLMEELKVLQRKSIEELNMREMANMLGKIELLENLGRQRVINRKIAYEQEKGKILAELVAGTSALQTKDLFEAKPGESLSSSEKLKNYVTKAQNAALRLDMILSPTHIPFDVLDGIAGYQGVNSRLIYQTLNTKFGNYLETTHEWQAPVQELADKLKLSEKNFERIAIHAYRAQEDGINYLENEGLSKDEIESIVLTKDELQLYDKMREYIEKPYQQALNQLRDLYNKNMGKIENYFPVQVDFDKASDVEISQRIGDMLDEGSFRRRTKTVEQGSTKERVGTKKRIKFDAMEVFTKHMDDMAYFVEMQRDIKILAEIVASPKYRAAAGDAGSKWVMKFMDLMARKGGGDGYRKVPALDVLRKNFGASMLGFKLSSIMIQPTALFDGAAQVGGGYVSQGMQRVIVDQRWREFLKGVPELKARGADDAAYLDLAENKLLRGYQNAGFSALKKADILTASAVVAGAYQKSLDQRGIEMDFSVVDKQAMEDATAVLRRTQSSPFFKDSPQALSGEFSGNKSLDKAIFQFKSFMLSRWGQIRHDMWRAGFKEGNNQRGSEIAFWLAMSTVAETGLRLGSKAIVAGAIGLAIGGADDALDAMAEEWDKEKERWSSLTNVLLEPLSNIPFVGDLISIGRYDGIPIPTLRPFVDFPAGVKQAVGGEDASSRMRGAAKAIGSVAASFGVPGTYQIEQLIRKALQSKSSKAAASNKLSLGGRGSLGNKLSLE